MFLRMSDRPGSAANVSVKRRSSHDEEPVEGGCYGEAAEAFGSPGLEPMSSARTHSTSRYTRTFEARGILAEKCFKRYEEVFPGKYRQSQESPGGKN